MSSSVHFDVYDLGERENVTELRPSATARKVATITLVVMVVGLVLFGGHKMTRPQSDVVTIVNSANLIHHQRIKSVLPNPFQAKPNACSPIQSQSSMICIPAGQSSGFLSNSFASFVVPTGGLLSKIILTWKSGTMQFCGKASAAYCKGRWGMSATGYGFGVYVSRNDGLTLLYPTGGVKGITKAVATGWYNLGNSPNTFDGATFVMDLGAQFSVSAGEVLRFYSGEAFTKVAWTDNYDQTCADVKLVFDQGPMSRVCIPSQDLSGSVDYAFGAIAAPQSGVIQSITLTVASGGINYCGPANPNCVGTFGCQITDFQMYMTRQDPKQVLYPTGGTEGISPGAYNGYKLVNPGSGGHGANTLKLSGPQQPVVAGEELRFYVGEALKKGTYGDNSNQMCVDVTFDFAQSSMICIPAGQSSGFLSNSFASFVVPTGGLLSKIILTWKSGTMQFCGKASAAYCKGRWGMSATGYGFGVYVSRNDGSTLLYPTGGVKGITKAVATGWYNLGNSPNTFDGATFVMDLGAQFSVSAGEVLRFYSGEAFTKVAWTDNYDQTCADVKLVFDQGPTNIVCIPANFKDNSGSADFGFAALSCPLTGTLHSVQLDVLSGGINYCPPSASCSGTFGSTITDYQIYMTRQDPLEVLYPTGGTRGIAPGAYQGYKLPAKNQSVAQTLILDLPQQPVAANEELRFYVGEVLKKTSYSDNSGQMCVKVTFNIDTQATTCGAFSTEVQCTGQCNLKCKWDLSTSACKCSSAPLDFVFLVDGSGSVSAASFLVQKQMVKDMILHMTPANSSIGIVQFSNVLKNELDLVPQVAEQTALAAVDSMTQLTGGTNIGDAMNRALTGPNFLANAQVRPNQRIVLVTDGQSNGGIDPCSLQSQIQAVPGLRVLIVGVSSGFSRAGVLCLVQHQPDPPSWIVEIPSYSLSEFQAVVPDLNAKICG